MPYCAGAYSAYSSLPVPSGSSLVISRKIDFSTKRYVQDDDGGFESMPSVAQRVLLKVSFAGIEQRIKDPRETARVDQEILAALSDMTTGPEPEIVIDELTTNDHQAGALRRTLRFRDLTTGTPGTVLL